MVWALAVCLPLHALFVPPVLASQLPSVATEAEVTQPISADHPGVNRGSSYASGQCWWRRATNGTTARGRGKPPIGLWAQAAGGKGWA